MIKKISTITAGLFLPLLTTAQGRLDATSASSLVVAAHKLINETLIPILVSGAVLYTVYTIVVFIGESADSQKKEEKKQQIFWAVIGLFIIVSIWGLVALVGRSFKIFAGGSLSI